MAYAVWANAHPTMNLSQGWSFTSVPPGHISQPSELTDPTLNWTPALVPGTVAAALRAAGIFKYGEHDFDASDYWFRCADPLEGALKEAQHLLLNLDGLATLEDAAGGPAAIAVGTHDAARADSRLVATRRTRGTVPCHFAGSAHGIDAEAH